jgi:8-oxo-dGTP diphosphatase
MLDNLQSIRHAVVVLVRDGDEMLFIERAKTDSYPGYWSAVTGAIEPGESQHDACIREAAEEVGLTVKPARKLFESMTRRASFLLHWWECDLAGPRNVTPQPSEVGAWQWLSPARAADLPLMFSDTRYFLREVYPLLNRA